MTIDNHILGSFTLHDIPPNLAGSETFKIIFDLDADGILNVTATHNQSGRKKAITIDSKSSGRMSSKEINNLVKKAEEMRVFDEYEESRVVCQINCRHFAEILNWNSSVLQFLEICS